MVLSDARKLSEQELLEKLESLGITIDKNTFKELCNGYISAEELSQYLTKRYKIISGEDCDWVWFCIAILWEKWFKNIPNLEMIDDKMQKGYSECKKDHTIRACEIWLSYWDDVLALMEKWGVQSIKEFDTRFNQTQSVYNWCQDFEMELHNASLRDVGYNQYRIEFCEKILSLIDKEEKLIIGNMLMAIAESYFNMGRASKADELYKEWLEADPTWGWGWIGWSDLYWLSPKKGYHNLEKAEKKLIEAIENEDIRDKRDVLERLSDFYNDIKAVDKKNKINCQIALLNKEHREVHTHLLNEANPNDFPYTSSAQKLAREIPKKGKIGRNDPCPCGSGKKYKKCCGRYTK
jgi:tetratricopeptide (TPR) repeat protein